MGRKVKILDRRFVPAGELVIEQGNLGNRAYYIERGRAEVFVRDARGRTLKIAEVGPGAIIGEMALLHDGKRSASIRTLEDSVLVTISAKDLQETVGREGGLFDKVMKMVVERLKDTNAKLARHNSAAEEAHLSVQRVAQMIPQEKQGDFKKDVVPLLDRLKATLEKYT